MVYKLLQDFNYTTSDDEILVLKKGTTIDRKEGDVYIIKQGRQQEFTIKCFKYATFMLSLSYNINI